jgi:hypothetical protein
MIREWIDALFRRLGYIRLDAYRRALLERAPRTAELPPGIDLPLVAPPQRPAPAPASRPPRPTPMSVPQPIAMPPPAAARQRVARGSWEGPLSGIRAPLPARPPARHVPLIANDARADRDPSRSAPRPLPPAPSDWDPREHAETHVFHPPPRVRRRTRDAIDRDTRVDVEPAWPPTRRRRR